MLLSGLAALVLAAAVAPEQTIELQWTAPAECPDRDDVLVRLDRLVAATTTIHVRARADVTANEDGSWSLVLAIEASDGMHAHTWRAALCESLADATALAIAVAADPIELTRTLVPAPPAVAAPAVMREPPVDSSSEPVAPPPDRPQRSRRVDGYVRAQGMVGVLLLPTIDAGGAIAVGLQHRRLRVELVGGVIAPRHAAFDQSRAGVRLMAGTITLHGCWMTPTRIAVGLCGVGEVAVVRGEGTDVQRRATRHDPWIGVGVGPLVQIPVARRWQLHLGGDALIAVRRPKFAIRDAPEDFVKPGPAGVRGFVGVAFGSWNRRARTP